MGLADGEALCDVAKALPFDIAQHERRSLEGREAIDDLRDGSPELTSSHDAFRIGRLPGENRTGPSPVRREGIAMDRLCRAGLFAPGPLIFPSHDRIVFEQSEEPP